MQSELFFLKARNFKRIVQFSKWLVKRNAGLQGREESRTSVCVRAIGWDATLMLCISPPPTKYSGAVVQSYCVLGYRNGKWKMSQELNLIRLEGKDCQQIPVLRKTCMLGMPPLSSAEIEPLLSSEKWLGVTESWMAQGYVEISAEELTTCK